MHKTKKMRYSYTLFLLLISLIIAYIKCEIVDIENDDVESDGIQAIDSDFLYLSINKSSLPFQGVGLGVFSKVLIPRNEIICEYRGVVIPSTTPFQSDYLYSSKTPTGDQINIVPDMNKPICAYINDCARILESNYTAAELNDVERTGVDLPTYSGFSYNAWTMYTPLGKVFIVALVDIPANTEIFYPYGSGYWIVRLRHPHVFNLPISPPSGSVESSTSIPITES